MLFSLETAFQLVLFPFLFFGRKAILFLFLEAKICQISAFSGNQGLLSFSAAYAEDEVGQVKEFNFSFCSEATLGQSFNDV